MHSLKLLAAVAVTSAVFGTAGVLAQSNSDFTKTDGNNDGKITRTEAQGTFTSLTPELFDHADVNHDGVLDETEWPLIAGMMAGERNGSSSAQEQPSSQAPAPSSSEEQESSSSSEPI